MSDDLPGNSYDDVPYRSYPFPQSHPERMKTIAKLFGLESPDLDQCSVLEIGCAAGGNLLPMASRHLKSKFLGIDLSSRQINDGNKIVRSVGMKNLELRHQDINDFNCDGQFFDYIICHGVYSWIPATAQRKVLEIFRDCLSADGIAYVSYNTFPGWHMRGMIRHLMEYRSRNLADAGDRVRQARSLLHFLAESVSKDNNPYGMMLEQEAQQLQDKDDYYLLHEHLEEFNEPVYFHKFAALAEEMGLQYLGEAEFGTMSLQNFPPNVAKMLGSLSGNIIEMEQYMDFARNRMFRQTLLCRDNLRLDRSIQLKKVTEMSLATRARPESAPQDFADKTPVVFRNQQAVTTTTDGLTKAALSHLGNVWPRYVPFRELYSMARSRTSSNEFTIGYDQNSPGAIELAKVLLRCFETGLVELSAQPAEASDGGEAIPCVTPLCRYGAANGSEVTNLRHQLIRLTEIESQVLQHLDGKTSREKLQSLVFQWIVRNQVSVRRQGRQVVDESELMQVAEQAISDSLSKFARDALLIGIGSDIADAN